MTTDTTTETQPTTPAPEAEAAAPIIPAPAVLPADPTRDLQQYIHEQGLGPAPEATKAGESAAAIGAPAPASETKPEAPSTPAMPEHVTEEVQQAGRHLGYSESEIAELSPKEAARTVRASRQLRAAGTESGRLKAQVEQLTKAKPAAPAEPPPPAEAAASEDDLVEIDPEVDSIEEVAAKLNPLIRATRETRKGQRQQREEQVKADSAAAVTETNEFFASLDVTVYDQFGGAIPTGQLDEYGPAAACRRELLREAAVVSQSAALRGVSKSRKQCLLDALRLTNPDQYIRELAKPRQQQIDRRAAGGAARPSSTATLPKNLSPEETARAGMIEAAAELGIAMH